MYKLCICAISCKKFTSLDGGRLAWNFETLQSVNQLCSLLSLPLSLPTVQNRDYGKKLYINFG